MPRLIGDLLPYLGMLVAFTGFVIWNGGVVLGESGTAHSNIRLTEYRRQREPRCKRTSSADAVYLAIHRLLLLACAPAWHCKAIPQKAAAAFRRSARDGTDASRSPLQHHCSSFHACG